VIEKLSVLKAELMMKVAGFILQKHTNPVLNALARSAAWMNQKRYGSDALDFLENEKSIDLLDDEKYESTEQGKQ